MQALFYAMPIGFWDDPDQKDIDQPIFERFDGVWTHGDMLKEQPKMDLSFTVVLMRSSILESPQHRHAEIYRQVETFEEILEALAIGQEKNNDIACSFVRRYERATRANRRFEGSTTPANQAEEKLAQACSRFDCFSSGI